MDIASLITQLVGGAAGGNAAGAMLKDKNPGGLINTITGALGGGIVGQIVQQFTGGGFDMQNIQSVLTSLGGGFGGGGVLAGIVGFIKNKMATKA